MLFTIVYAGMTLVDINPQKVKLDLDKDGFEFLSFSHLLEKYRYTDENGFLDAKRLDMDIVATTDEVLKTQMQLIKVFTEIKEKVKTYDYNRKDLQLRVETAEECNKVSALLGKLISLRMKRKVMCSSGSYRFPANPGSLRNQTNYASSVMHIDGSPGLSARFKDAIQFTEKQFKELNHTDAFYPLLHQKYSELDYWRLLTTKDDWWLKDNYAMVNLWMPMNDGEVENFPLVFKRGQMELKDFSWFQRLITWNRPLLHFPSGNYQLCMWDKMRFGDYFLFKSLKVAHMALDLNKYLPEKRISNRKSFEIRCFYQK